MRRTQCWLLTVFAALAVLIMVTLLNSQGTPISPEASHADAQSLAREAISSEAPAKPLVLPTTARPQEPSSRQPSTVSRTQGQQVQRDSHRPVERGVATQAGLAGGGTSNLESQCVCEQGDCKIPALGRPLRACFEHNAEIAWKWEGLLRTSTDKKHGQGSLMSKSCVQLADQKKPCSKLGKASLPVDVIITDLDDVKALFQLLEPAGIVQQLLGGAWVVLAERHDSVTLRHRALLRFGRLAGYLKEYAPRNLSQLNTLPGGEKGRWHYKILCNLIKDQHDNCRYSLPPPSKPFTNDELRKVMPVSWNWQQYHIYFHGALREVFKSAEELFETPKDECDLFLVAHVRPYLVGYFRKVALVAAKALAKQPMPGRPKGPRLCVHSEGLPFKEYGRKLSRSQAALCPWGLGERTACDEHAALVGAIVLKPRMDFVEAVPDFYRDGVNYVAVREDFSDLSDKLAFVLEDPSGRASAIRERAHRLLLGTSRMTIAKDFWEKLRNRVAAASGGTFQKPGPKEDLVYGSGPFRTADICESPDGSKLRFGICP